MEWFSAQSSQTESFSVVFGIVEKPGKLVKKRMTLTIGRAPSPTQIRPINSAGHLEGQVNTWKNQPSLLPTGESLVINKRKAQLTLSVCLSFNNAF
jgi:hypothetical protein